LLGIGRPALIFFMKTVTINSRKFDGKIRRSWKCELLEETSDYWLFVGEFAEEIRHSKLDVIRRGTVSYEYYWKETWFNVFRFHEPEGDFKFFYCNLNLPPKFEQNILDYVDLDIDVLVHSDYSFEILDEDEFCENADFFQYPKDLILKTYICLKELLSKIERRQFPFNCKNL
jgi:protein associated with RNAse G/E